MRGEAELARNNTAKALIASVGEYETAGAV